VINVTPRRRSCEWSYHLPTKDQDFFYAHQRAEESMWDISDRIGLGPRDQPQFPRPERTP